MSDEEFYINEPEGINADHLFVLLLLAAVVIGSYDLYLRFYPPNCESQLETKVEKERVYMCSNDPACLALQNVPTNLVPVPGTYQVCGVLEWTGAKWK